MKIILFIFIIHMIQNAFHNKSTEDTYNDDQITIQYDLIKKMKPPIYVKTSFYISNSLIKKLRAKKIIPAVYLRDIFKEINQIFSWHDIRLFPNRVEMWSITDGFHINMNFLDNLEKLKVYVKKHNHKADTYHLFRDLGHFGVIGEAYLNVLCTEDALGSSEVGDSHNYQSRLAGYVVAHELFHNFGSDHYDSFECNCAFTGNKCLMATFTYKLETSYQTAAHPCSIDAIQTYIISRQKKCMLHEFPKYRMLKSYFTCGNNIQEPGEDCDCGDFKACELSGRSTCCNPHTCKFSRSNFQCEKGPCCQNCMFRTSGKCRNRIGECDFDDYCNGTSSECYDYGKPDGASCSNQSVCINFKCPDTSDPCSKFLDQPHVGQISYTCHEKVRNYYARTEIPLDAAPYDILRGRNKGICGAVYCSGYVDSNNKIKIERLEIINDTTGVTFYCSYVYYLTDRVKYGMMQNGAFCMKDKVCYDSQCIAKSEINSDCWNRNCPSGYVINHQCQCMKLHREKYILLPANEPKEEEEIITEKPTETTKIQLPPTPPPRPKPPTSKTIPEHPFPKSEKPKTESNFPVQPKPNPNLGTPSIERTDINFPNLHPNSSHVPPPVVPKNPTNIPGRTPEYPKLLYTVDVYSETIKADKSGGSRGKDGFEFGEGILPKIMNITLDEFVKHGQSSSLILIQCILSIISLLVGYRIGLLINK